MLRILNFGAGVQSSCILLRSCLGELPKLDHAIFADTGDEPAYVYDWMTTAKLIAADYGIPVHVVGRGHSLSSHLEERISSGRRLDKIPAFCSGDEGAKYVPLRRDCTREYKIKCIDRHVKVLLGLKPRGHWPKQLEVETWIGISSDEFKRMKHSPFAWQRFWHPLIEQPWSGDKRPEWIDDPWDRTRCQKWLEERGFTGILRSACTFCPFRSNNEWRSLKVNDPPGFEKACQVDELLRSGPDGVIHGMRKPVFVHRSLKPLRDDPFNDHSGQQSLWDDECAGVCGV
jgi:hypothetical protein